MKFKLGDTVRVINKDLDSYNAIGKVVDIDTEWHLPYELKFDKQYHEDLFYESDLALVEVDESESIEENVDAKPRDFIDIKFQEGTVKDNGVNGAQIEDVIDVLVERLEGFQKGQFPCRENALAITKLEEARMWLNERTHRRKEQGVEGRNLKHE